MPEWTGRQMEAITATGTNLLVSAAAGSGKTSVLTQRCVHLVSDPQIRCGVDELLVVTFTEAAAAEMRSRVEQALRQRLEKSPEDEHLRRQCALIEHAHISTLHSFCLRLLRQHFHRLALDPSFRILDAEEAALLRLDVVRGLFAQRYDAQADADFERFIDAYGEGDDERLMDLVIGMHELLLSLLDPPEWMRQSESRLVQAVNLPLEESELGRQYLDIVRQRLEELRLDCQRAGQSVGRMPRFGAYVKYLAQLEEQARQFRGLLDQRSYDALVGAIRALDLPRKPSISSSTPGKEVASNLVGSIQDLFKKGSLIQMLQFSAAELRDGMRALLPHVRILLSLVDEFGQRYGRAKGAQRALDFSDLERYALGLLLERRDGNKLVPSAVARLLHRQFRFVLVDEYQDINEVQDAILALCSHESAAGGKETPPNLFCVGDVKQSIYAFRLAEAARFLQRLATFRNDSAAGRVIDLQDNFRSRGPLLDVLNLVFERLFIRSAADIDYDDSQRLHAKASFPAPGALPCFTGAPVELHLVPAVSQQKPETDEDAPESPEEELERSEREALCIANRVEQLMGHGGSPRMHISERRKDGSIFRPIGYRDIVILLRSMRYQADQYAGILRQRRIPVHCAGGGGYFDSIEIRDILSLLHLLDNQRQDVPLAAILRSPLARLPDAEDNLARIRLAHPDIPFHEAVQRYAFNSKTDDELAARLRDFLAELAEWRQLAQQRPVADLIWSIYQRTGFLAFCAGLPNGQQRVANLIALYERARQFGTFARQGLYRFNRFLETLRQEIDIAPASELSEADDVVRVMSIHKAKGLEFPVVFLPELGKRINFESSLGTILAERQAYLGLMAVDQSKNIRYPSLPWSLVAQRLRRQTIAEELRILYVGMTRAKEHLILVGTARNGAADVWSRRWELHDGPLPSNTILGAHTMLDWLGPVAATLQRGSPVPIQLTSHSSDELNQWLSAQPAANRPADASAALAQLTPLDPAPPADPAAAAIIGRLTRPYPHRPFCFLQASQSVTAWTKGESEPDHPAASDQPPSPRAPALAQPRKATAPPPATSLFDEPSLPPDDGAFEEFAAPPDSSPKGPPPPPSPAPSPTESALADARCLQEEAPLSSADRGTAVHLFLEHIDFSQAPTEENLAAQIGSLVDKRLMTEQQAAAVDLADIRWLLETDLGRLFRENAAGLLRELPLAYALPPQHFISASSDDPMDQVMLRGRIDLLIPDARGFTLIDYKTDRVSAETIEARTDYYRAQVDIYRQAIQKIAKLPVHTVHLVFLFARRIVTV